MISDEIAACLSRFFDGGHGPSHDELTRLFTREGFSTVDPGATTGKVKRVRDVFSHAIVLDIDGAGRAVQGLLGLLRASGCFRPTAEHYAGVDLVAALREAFSREGYELDPEGTLHPKQLEQLDGTDLTDALWAYVRRARAGSADASLVSGTVKDLTEAAARHVLVETTGSYPTTMNFPGTLYQAFDRLGLATPDLKLNQHLDPDPLKAIEQVLYLLGCLVNRTRNDDGTGHGRPQVSKLDDDDAKLLSGAAALCSELMLRSLDSSRGRRAS